MLEKICQPVSVELIYNSHTKKVYPNRINWQGKTYTVKKVGLHHFVRQGRTLFHIFSVATDDLFFRLSLNTDNLQWILEEVADDIAN